MRHLVQWHSTFQQWGSEEQKVVADSADQRPVHMYSSHAVQEPCWRCVQCVVHVYNTACMSPSGGAGHHTQHLAGREVAYPWARIGAVCLPVRGSSAWYAATSAAYDSGVCIT
jgi:hypothetical protein